MKKLVIFAALTVALVAAMSGVAFANFGPHGGYSLDTDACAGCHRAHTSASSVTWNDGTTDHSALLVSTASTMEEFCYACHGDGAPGASTNVEEGIFDAGPSGADNQALGADNDGVAVAYETNSSFGATLNGGGFRQVNGKDITSMHNMDEGAATDPMWGDGFSAPEGKNLTCTDCHDPHGSSNYRLLKDVVNVDNVVGGYDADGNPSPVVLSAEEGYPAGGWLLHQAGATQMETYRPNYTKPQYAFGDSPNGVTRSMSTWCSGCHERYDNKSDVTDGATYDYGDAESSGGVSMGARARHRHPVNITLVTDALTMVPTTSTVLPLEANSANNDRTVAEFRDGGWTSKDYLGCLTCHRAHGTSVDMTGWAEAKLVTNASAVVTWYPERSTQPTISGVNPNFTSALLRADNRGVCERCHNK